MGCSNSKNEAEHVNFSETRQYIGKVGFQAKRDKLAKKRVVIEDPNQYFKGDYTKLTNYLSKSLADRKKWLSKIEVICSDNFKVEYLLTINLR